MRWLRSLSQLTLFQLRSMMRNKIALAFNFAFPMLFLAVFGFMYAEKPGALTPVGVAAATDGAGVVELLKGTGRFSVELGTESDLSASLKAGDLKAVVVLPAGAGAGQGPVRVPVLYDPTSQSSLAAAGTLQAVLAGFGARPVLAVEAQPLPGMVKLNVFDFLLPGQLTYMLLSAGLVSVAIWLANQRKSGAMRHMFSTPVSVGLWLGARISANLLLAVIQAAVLYATAYFVFDIPMPVNVVGTVVAVVACALATLGLGLAVGVLAPNPDAAMPASLILIMALAFLGGSMMPLDGAPAIFQTLGKAMPSYYMTHALRAVMMQGGSLGTVVFDLMILGVCAVGGSGIAAWQLRRQFASV